MEFWGIEVIGEFISLNYWFRAIRIGFVIQWIFLINFTIDAFKVGCIIELKDIKIEFELVIYNFIFLIISIILRNKIGYAGAKYLGGEFQYLPENLIKFNLKNHLQIECFIMRIGIYVSSLLIITRANVRTLNCLYCEILAHFSNKLVLHYLGLP